MYDGFGMVWNLNLLYVFYSLWFNGKQKIMNFMILIELNETYKIDIFIIN